MATKAPEQGFHHSCTGCFSDCSQCMDTICCWNCQLGRQCSAVDGIPHNHNCGMCCLSYCFGCWFPMCLRCKVSDKFQLGENCCTSCICGSCFPACSVCQTGRELNYRGINPGGCCCVGAQQNQINNGVPGSPMAPGSPNYNNQPPNQPPMGSPHYEPRNHPAPPPSGPSYGNSNAYPPQQPNNNGV